MGNLFTVCQATGFLWDSWLWLFTFAVSQPFWKERLQRWRRIRLDAQDYSMYFSEFKDNLLQYKNKKILLCHEFEKRIIIETNKIKDVLQILGVNQNKEKNNYTNNVQFLLVKFHTKYNVCHIQFGSIWKFRTNNLLNFCFIFSAIKPKFNSWSQ